jgi:hypothetical protein
MEEGPWNLESKVLVEGISDHISITFKWPQKETNLLLPSNSIIGGSQRKNTKN